MICEICNRECKDLLCLSKHITAVHLKTGISAKNYYDTYLKKPDDGFCHNPNCNHTTKFRSLTLGYRRTCCHTCAQLDPLTKDHKETAFINHYGVNHPSKSKDFMTKKRNDLLARTGEDWPTKLNTVQEAIRNGIQNKPIDEKTAWLEKIKETRTDAHNKAVQTCIKKYGVENPRQVKDIADKIEQTCLDRYGVKHHFQNHEIFKKTKRKYKHDNLSFDSNWEIIFYDYLKHNDIAFEYQPNAVFEYEHEGKTHKYNPDFKVNETYIEIKGPHFFENGKMINPYDRSQDPLYEAKHQCMIRNHVKIITDISDYRIQ